MNQRTEFKILAVIYVIALIASVSTIFGFFTRDIDFIINSARFLSLSTLILLTYFANSVYKEMFTQDEQVNEVRMELRSKEDVEEFRKKLEEELRKYVEEIEEEERLDREE